MQRPKSAVATANEQVAFTLALQWVKLPDAARERGMKATCPACEERDALRVYSDHGWCFGEQRYFTTVTLLAEKWQMEPEDAARAALKRIGYEVDDYGRLWVDASRRPEPARDDLATALRTWCETYCPDWRTRQYDAAVAGKLSQCLGLLPRVQTEEDCDKWLTGCKVAMRRVLNPHLAK
jgi:hypothetical protein